MVEDIVDAAKSIFIAAPYVSAACLATLGDAIKGAAARGIALEIYLASTPREDAKETLAEMNVEYAIRAEGRLCAAIIDEETVWYGTIPLLAFPKNEDCSIRFKNSEIAAELLDEVSHKGKPDAASTDGTSPSLAVK